MAQKASAIVLAGNGTNCEVETAHACRSGGFTKVDIVTIWELLDADATLTDYDFLVFPGGFLDGDDLGSAKAQANRLLHTKIKGRDVTLFEQLLTFIDNGKLILGICNGFQLMIKLGLIPAMKQYGLQEATLTNNDSGRFEARWVNLKTNPDSPCVFTKGISSMYLPVRHGEGKFVPLDRDILAWITSRNQVVVSYTDPDQNNEVTIKYPQNPNGSQRGIAGICDPSGRIFGLMPHPEAYLHRTNHPRWTREELPEDGDGLAIFKNAFEYLHG